VPRRVSKNGMDSSKLVTAIPMCSMWVGFMIYSNKLIIKIRILKIGAKVQTFSGVSNM
jgi:hypothetical protein